MTEEIDSLDLKPRIGNCSVCGRENIKVRPIMWNFPFIECKCHRIVDLVESLTQNLKTVTSSVGHTEKKMICNDCESVCPQSMHVHFDTYILSAINELIYNHEDEYKEIKDRHYRLHFEHKEEEK